MAIESPPYLPDLNILEAEVHCEPEQETVGGPFEIIYGKFPVPTQIGGHFYYAGELRINVDAKKLEGMLKDGPKFRGYLKGWVEACGRYLKYNEGIVSFVTEEGFPEAEFLEGALTGEERPEAINDMDSLFAAITGIKALGNGRIEEHFRTEAAEEVARANIRREPGNLTRRLYGFTPTLMDFYTGDGVSYMLEQNIRHAPLKDVKELYYSMEARRGERRAGRERIALEKEMLYDEVEKRKGEASLLGYAKCRIGKWLAPKSCEAKYEKELGQRKEARQAYKQRLGAKEKEIREAISRKDSAATKRLERELYDIKNFKDGLRPKINQLRKMEEEFIRSDPEEKAFMKRYEEEGTKALLKWAFGNWRCSYEKAMERTLKKMSKIAQLPTNYKRDINILNDFLIGSYILYNTQAIPLEYERVGEKKKLNLLDDFGELKKFFEKAATKCKVEVGTPYLISIEASTGSPNRIIFPPYSKNPEESENQVTYPGRMAGIRVNFFGKDGSAGFRVPKRLNSAFATFAMLYDMTDQKIRKLEAP